MTLNTRPVLITFSGVDGSGKSTQIERLHSALLERHFQVKRLAFWDDVVVLPRLRGEVTHKVLGGEQGIGEPGKPVRRNDKNARRWYLTLARSPFYLFDAISLRRVVRRARGSNPDVIIFDRYIYDQIAHIPNNWIGRLARRFLLKLAPAPNIAYLLDADPEVATARKPEYPIDFVRKYRNDYFDLRPLAPELLVIPPGTVEVVGARILQEFEKRVSLAKTFSSSLPNARPERVST
jgi:thymidylate kinase